MLFALSAFSTVTVKAQYDTWMLNQWLNQLNADYYKQQQAISHQLGKVLELEIERQKSQATAFCQILPGGEDTFYAYVTLIYLGKDDVDLIEVDASGKKWKLKPSSYFYANNTIITNAVFSPGSTVYVWHKKKGKKLSSVDIPLKSSSDYAEFVQNAMVVANSISNQLMPSGTINSGGSSMTPSSTTRTCSLCNGKGWIAGSKTPTYGSTTQHWCDECQRTVNPSHSHDRCPSCSGMGYRKSIGR